jgi:hypothetical protein
VGFAGGDLFVVELPGPGGLPEAAEGPSLDGLHSSVYWSRASRQQIRASASSSFFFAGPRRRATRSGLTGSTVNPASTSAPTSSRWWVSSTTRTSAGQAPAPGNGPPPPGRARYGTARSPPGPAARAQHRGTTRPSPPPHRARRPIQVHGHRRRRRYALLMDQSSKDNTPVGFGPPPVTPGDAVSFQSSQQDKHTKRPPGAPDEGRRQCHQHTCSALRRLLARARR